MHLVDTERALKNDNKEVKKQYNYVCIVINISEVCGQCVVFLDPADQIPPRLSFFALELLLNYREELRQKQKHRN